MKRTLLGAALTAALTIISSCTKSDILEEQERVPITYATSVETHTRIINGTTYPTSETFGVTAYYKPVGGGYDFLDAGKYFDNLQISYVSASSSWKNSAIPYYWPPKGALKFIATSPYNKVYPSYNTTNGVQFSGFEQSTSMVDLMYAESTNDLTSGPVALTFKHALTQLYFTIQTQQLGVSFRIKRIDVQNVCNQGSFKSLPTPAWTKTGENDTNFNVYNDSTGVLISSLDATPYEFPNRLLLIPQSVSGIVIRITYDYLIAGLISLSGATKNINLSGNAWQANQRIKYAITISQSILPITYSPLVTDWDTDINGSY